MYKASTRVDNKIYDKKINNNWTLVGISEESYINY